MKLDSHQHFWRYDAGQYPWIPAGSPLQRDWLPADLAALQAPLGFGGSIAVQARQSLAESHWLLGLADADPRILGVVGWVDLQSDSVEESLAALAAHPKFVGVRHVVQDEPDDRFMLRPAFLRGLGRLRAHGLTYDLLVYPRQLPAAIEVVRQFPEQPFVLDHIAKPLIRDGVVAPWCERIRELARFPNVCCKVSGMVTEADHRSWKPDQFLPYLDWVLEAFGPGRLMFGSDWPVCLLAATYPEVLELATEALVARAGWTAAEQDAFFQGNARHFYLD
ncbi:MAG: amidohydrolase family protein [Verrucomicrobiales bacterium]|nr:amidohydrolase family protein [Verrucomicrobiales bacterium]